MEFAAGSHRVAHTADPWAPVQNADRPKRPSDEDFVDPELRRGDLAIVNMHTWHRAGPNNSERHRTGMFTKWCAASHPPATGYYPYTDERAPGARVPTASTSWGSAPTGPSAPPGPSSSG